MEHRLAVVPLLEKEKLHLQKQVNEILQENEKRKSEVELVSTTVEKEKLEREELQTKNQTLSTDLEKSYEEIKELKQKNILLEEVKSSLTRKNDENVASLDEYRNSIDKLTSSNSALVQQNDEARNKISILLEGLKSLKECVAKLKEEKQDLQSQIIDKGGELAHTMKSCVSGLEKVVSVMEKEKRVTLEDELCNDMKNKSDKSVQCSDVKSVELILGQLEGNKDLLDCFKNKINEWERNHAKNLEGQNELTPAGDATGEDAITEDQSSDCAMCKSRQIQLDTLSIELDSIRNSLQKLQSEKDEVVEEKNELKREAKYLKYVLSYREDVQNLQVSNQQSKELEKMSSNLEEAEKKVNDLEEEVGRLQEEKQTLLMSILNLYSGQEIEDVKEEDEEEAVDEMKSENNNENDESNGEVFVQSPSAGGRSPRTPEALARREQLKFRFQLSLSESEYSYTSDRPESEDESDDSAVETHVRAIKSENKQLKSNLYETNEAKEELLSSLDKLCEEYDSLKATHDQLEEEHSQLVDRTMKDKIAYQARLQQLEMERENMRDTLRQVQDEKLSLLKCLEMKNFEAQPLPSPVPGLDLEKIIARAHSLAQEESKVSESTSVPNSELEKIIAHAQSFTQEESKSGEETLMPNTEMDEIIARAQSFTRKESISKEPKSVSSPEMDMIIARARSFTREENKSSEPTSNEEDSDASLSSETEDYTSDQSYNKAITSEGTPDSQYATSNGQINRSNPEDSDLAGIVASIENDLSKLKERLYKRDASGKSHVRQSSQHFTTLWAFVVDCFANSKLAIDRFHCHAIKK